MMKMSTKDGIGDIYFLYYIFTFNEMQKQIQIMAGGNVQPIFNFTTLKKMRILLPPLSEQQKIASILSNIDSKITSQEQYKEKLEKLKKSLMQKLLTGEVRV